MQTILNINDVKKNFGKTKVLKGVSLSVNEGEIISVLGPSGCGKSTLLRIIAGILPLDDGAVTIRGKEVSGKHRTVATEKRDVNMVFQDFALWPHMTAEKNISYGLKVKKIEKNDINRRINEITSLLHLEGLLDHYPSELSGGQQQRVAIARALVTKPSIVLLDEPLCNLDVQLRIEMRTEMAYLFHKLGTTVFHVTHDPSEAFAMADRIIVMNNGKIDQADTPANCFRTPASSMVAGLLGAGNKLTNKHFISESDGKATVMINDNEVFGILPAGKDLQKDSQVELLFRPEDSHWSSNKVSGSFRVTVLLSTFEGSNYRVKVRTEDGDEFCILHKDILDEGTCGHVYVDPERMYIYGQTDN